MSNYHCPTCLINEAQTIPAYSFGAHYCPKHWEADPAVIAWRKGAAILAEKFAEIDKANAGKA